MPPTRSKRALRLVAALGIAVLGLGAVAVGAEPRPLALDVRSAGPLLLSAARSEPVSVSVPGFGSMRLLLRANPILAPGAVTTETGADGVARAVPRPAIHTLAGNVVGDKTSDVRLTIAPSGVGGYVSTKGRRIWIEPAPSDPMRTIAYVETPGTIDFGDDTAQPSSASHGGEVNALGLGSCRVQACDELTAHVILDGDVYYRNLGSDCFGRQMTVMNAVTGIYAAAATRIRLSVAQQNCRTSASLGTNATEPLPLLNNLTNAWQVEGKSRSLVFLFVGYDFPSATVGVAWTPGVCSRVDPDPTAGASQRCRNGYSLGQMVGSIGTLDTRTKVAAHEIGHNFDAAHDDTGCNGSGKLMCPSIQGTGPLQFSATSANQIRSHAENTIGYLVKI